METVKIQISRVNKQTGHEDIIHADWCDVSEPDMRVVLARAPGLVTAALQSLTRDPVHPSHD